MKKIIPLLFILLPIFSFAQVKLKIVQLDSLRYGVYYTSFVDLNPPLNTTNNAQITVKASTGGLEFDSIESHLGNWSSPNRVVGPLEAPEYEYWSFVLQTASSDFIYKIGHEDLLFTFSIKKPILGDFHLIDKEDPFYPPNSKSVNVGNLIKVLGLGFVNAFSGIYTCSEEIIIGFTFWDENNNGIRDSLERLVRNVPIELTPNSTFSYTDEEGFFRFYVENNKSYTLNVLSDSCWQVANDSSSYTLTVTDSMSLELGFGLQLKTDSKHTQSRINSAPTRCGFVVPFSLSVENDGCVPARGKYGIVLSPLVNLISSEIEPTEKRGDTLIWTYEELIVSEIKELKLTFEIAGTDFIGSLINLTGLSYIEDEFGNLDLSSTYSYSSEIRCAYDPNDKQVTPNRLQEYAENYSLFDETLEYTIRFQNTGNDTAFNVVLRDTLDKKLDWTTFRPVVSSHPYETLLNSKDGAVEFSFRDILLPDSTTNEPLSHGFITYKITPQQGLPEHTFIENTASIYFDFNPPIVTNTTQNVLVSELPKITSSSLIYVQIKSFLGGAYEKNTKLMRDDLRTHAYIPLQEPYTDIVLNEINLFTHYGAGGGEVIEDGVLEITGEDAIVDWVFLEIRSSDDETNILQTRAALLQRDGDVVEVDGRSPVVFPAIEGAYYVLLRHRNHLSVMTKLPVALNSDKNSPTLVDFTSAAVETWGLNAQKMVGDTQVMWEGDTDGNGYVIFQGSGIGVPDPDGVFFTIFLDKFNNPTTYNYISRGYYLGDVNLDGAVKYQGLNSDADLIFFNVLFHPQNLNLFTSFFIEEQVPVKK